MYRTPEVTVLTPAHIVDLLGPVETQYTGGNIDALCGGCDAVSAQVAGNSVVNLQVTAPDCAGQTSAFRLTLRPTAQVLGIAINPQVIVLPVGDGTFNGDVWTYTDAIAVAFSGNVTLQVDVLDGQGSTGPLCQTTIQVNARN
jgi:hypothetical protein